jgi:hypothetical protein
MMHNLSLLVLLTVRLIWAGPSLNLKEKTFDFGPLIQGDVVTHTFTVLNSGNAPLSISKITPSCGCTIGKLSKDYFKPGENGGLEVTFNSDRFVGPQRKSITISGNDPENPSLQVYFTADVQAAYEMQPGHIAFNAEKDNSTLKEKEIPLYIINRHKATLNSIDIKILDVGLAFEKSFPLTTSLTIGDTLRIMIKPGLQEKILSSKYGSLNVKLTYADGRRLEKRIGVTIKKWRSEESSLK